MSLKITQRQHVKRDMSVTHRLVLAVVNPCTKFEICGFTVFTGKNAM